MVKLSHSHSHFTNWVISVSNTKDGSQSSTEYWGDYVSRFSSSVSTILAEAQ